MHNFCTKMSKYSHYIYFLQEKSIHFHRRVLKDSGLEVSGYFELCQVLKHIFLCQKSRYSHYIHLLQENSTYFYRRVFVNFGLELSGHLDPEKSYKKNQKNSQEFSNYIKSSCMISVLKYPYIPKLYIAYMMNQNIFGSMSFELYQIFVYNFLCQIVPILPYCIIVTRTKSIFKHLSFLSAYSSVIFHDTCYFISQLFLK